MSVRSSFIDYVVRLTNNSRKNITNIIPQQSITTFILFLNRQCARARARARVCVCVCVFCVCCLCVRARADGVNDEVQSLISAWSDPRHVHAVGFDPGPAEECPDQPVAGAHGVVDQDVAGSFGEKQYVDQREAGQGQVVLQYREALWIQLFYNIGRPCGYSYFTISGGLVDTVILQYREALWLQLLYNIGRPCGYNYFTISGGLVDSYFTVLGGLVDSYFTVLGGLVDSYFTISGGLVDTVILQYWEALWIQLFYNIGRPCG